MPLKFNFEHFNHVPDLELVTIPDFEIFSDGNNPLIRRQTLIEVSPGVHTRMDIVADLVGVFFFVDGQCKHSWPASEGRTLNMVRELDEVDIVPNELLTRYNFEV